MISPHLITLFICEFLILFFAFISLFFSFKIARNFDINSLDPKQYKLSKTAYLVASLIVFILVLKLLLFLFFIFILDSFSHKIPGVMCAVGVIDATNFGIFLLMLKILNLFLLSGWLFVNFLDSKSKTAELTKLKFRAFCVLFWFLLAEFVLLILHFNGIDTTQIAICCTEIFKTNELGALPFYQKNSVILLSFYFTFFFMIIASYLRFYRVFAVLNFAFFSVCIHAIIRYFSPYIYELPLHKCPFCFLQSEYYFVGYLIYTLLYFGTLGGVFVLICEILKIKQSAKILKFSNLANFALLVLLSSYVLIYFFKHSVFL